ncbi:MAG: hypothetical protein V1933_08045 [Candidatus Omnitrophota bacterium]
MSKTVKCQNCNATIEVETGKTYFEGGEINKIAELEAKVNHLAKFASQKAKKMKGAKPDEVKKAPEETQDRDDSPFIF